VNKRFIIGLFKQEDQAAAAVEAVADTPWKVEKVYSPIPSESITDALKLKKSPVGYFTLTGGIIGFITGFALAVFTATRWSLMVSGKPVVALVPFFIVGFEFTILFAVFGNIIGMLFQARLPAWGADRHYNTHHGGEYFRVLVSCPEAQRKDLMALVEAHGGDARDNDANDANAV
jgi:molybdopterin-containing oxidoreductase family membrane subunit